MPGLHYFFSPRKPLDRSAVDSALRHVLHDHRYGIEEIYSDDHCCLTLTRYPSYPVAVCRQERYLAVLEGRLYLRRDTNTGQLLGGLADIVFGHIPGGPNALGRFLEGCDGEFVIALMERNTRRWAFLNDALSRLPLYTCEQDDALVITREIGLPPRLAVKPRPDRLGLAQLLMLGFPLGSRTLMESVSHVGPATLISVSSRTGDVKRQSVLAANVETSFPVSSVGDAAARLADLFVSGCSVRTSGFSTSVISLSGGLDSRSVAAALHQIGCRTMAFTFDDGNQSSRADVSSAQEIAQRLSLDWHLVKLPDTSGSDILDFFRFKPGLLNPSNASDVHYLGAILSRAGQDTVYFSGDGGDTLIPRISPKYQLGSTPTAHILHRYCLWQPKQAASLTGIAPNLLWDSLREAVGAYPEQSAQRRFMHFMIYEKATRWIFEAEDRNRCAMWAVTPFYSLPFCREAISYSERIKEGHRLYREFLRRLPGQVVEVVDPKYRLSPDMLRYERRSRAMTRIRSLPRILHFMQQVIRGRSFYGADSALVQCIRHQAKSTPAVHETLDPHILDSVLNHPESVSRVAMTSLFNVTTFLSMLNDDLRSLKAYSRTPLLK